MFKKVAIVAGLSMLAAGTANADYRWELGASYAGGDVETDTLDGDRDSYNFQGKFFLDRVDTSKGPLGEAEFLDRASYIQLDYGTGELDRDHGDEDDIDSYQVKGRYVHKATGWMADLNYRVDDFEEDDLDSYGVGVGKYLGENTTLMLTYEHAEFDDADDIEADVWGLNVEHLFSFGNGMSLKLSGGYSYVDTDYGDDGDKYSLAGTYYFNDRIGFGASYEVLDAEDQLDSWKVYADVFVTEQVLFTVSYGDSELDDYNFDSDEFLVGIKYRF
ncbi:MAG: putative porin [Parahaliea sp.]